MKILHVIPCFVPAWGCGGAVQASYGLCRQLVNRGHEVTVYTTDALDGKSRIGVPDELIDGIRVRRFRNLSNYLACRHKMFLPPGMAPAARRGLGRFDIMHLYASRTVPDVIAHYYAVRRGVPYVIQSHSPAFRTGEKQKLINVYDAAWGRRVLSDAARVIALTVAEAEQYRAMGVARERVELLPCGIEADEFEHLPHGNGFRARHGLADSDLVVLCHVSDTRGVDLLVKAFAGIPAQAGNARLVIAGLDGGRLPYLEKAAGEVGLLEESLVFAGPLYGQERLEAYAAAGLFVQPSGRETFPFGLLEACASGLPVIFARDCGVADLLDGNAGLAVDLDWLQIRTALLRLLLDHQARHRFGENGRRLVRERFNLSGTADRLEEMYKVLAGKSPDKIACRGL